MPPKKTSKIGILGLGEVGRATAKFYKNPRIKTRKGRNDDLRGIEILHICISYNDNFVKTIAREIKLAKPKLTIIHSTVAPLTTEKICQAVKSKMIVHSPIRGIHPYLYSGIKTFVKYVGAENKKAGLLAKRHLQSVGMKVKVFNPAVTTEVGKLLSTTYYGLCIAWHGEMLKVCKKAGVDFDQAITDFNKSYNKGYVKLGKANVIRPVLYPPKGSIGGHCVVPNAKILEKFLKTDGGKLVLKYK